MYSTLLTLTLLTTILAHPERLEKRELKVGEWAAPTEGQVRGPCPALNTLANHGYLRRDGGDETGEKYKAALKEVYNVGTDVTSVILSRAKKVGVLHDNMFSQKDLQRHALPTPNGEGPEHDGSQTREDKSLGDTIKVNLSRVDQMISFAQDGYLTAEGMGLFQKARFDESRSRNPELNLKGIPLMVTVAQAAVIFPSFSEGDKGIPVAFIRSFYGQEKLPDNYTKPENTNNLFRVVGAMRHVMGNNGLGLTDFVGDGLKFTGSSNQSAAASTVKSVSLKEAVSALVENNTDSCPPALVQAAVTMANPNIKFSCNDSKTSASLTESLSKYPPANSSSTSSIIISASSGTAPLGITVLAKTVALFACAVYL